MRLRWTSYLQRRFFIANGEIQVIRLRETQNTWSVYNMSIQLKVVLCCAPTEDKYTEKTLFRHIFIVTL